MYIAADTGLEYLIRQSARCCTVTFVLRSQVERGEGEILGKSRVLLFLSWKRTGKTCSRVMVAVSSRWQLRPPPRSCPAVSGVGLAQNFMPWPVDCRDVHSVLASISLKWLGFTTVSNVVTLLETEQTQVLGEYFLETTT